MLIPFDRRFVVISLIELSLAGTVFSAAFLIAVSAYQPLLEVHASTAVVAQLTFVLCLLLPASVCGLHRLRRDERVHSVLLKVVGSLVLGVALCYALFALLPPISPYRTAIPDAVVVGAIGLVAVRLALSSSLQFDVFRHRVLVLGTGADALAVDHALRRLSNRGVTVVGFYGTDAATPMMVAPARVIPSSQPLEAIIAAQGVHEIVVAVREQRGGGMPLVQLLNCRLQGVSVTDVCGVFERLTGTVPLDSLKASWLIYGKGFRQHWGRRAVKRGFDVTVSIMVLALAMPVMLLAALAIYMESGRPIVLRQERVGRAGRRFMLLKFRSMCNDAERDGVPRWAAADDPRITRVGRVMRRTRMDELPQIFNILKGEMSFVGPRPERPHFVSQLAQHISFYGARHSVKPGLTGWAQVRYSYGASLQDAVRKLEYDLYYVKNQSLLLDLLILVRTIRVVLAGDGAR
jgi:sugar transferase (PEP-CTERM system associated)